MGVVAESSINAAHAVSESLRISLCDGDPIMSDRSRILISLPNQFKGWLIASTVASKGLVFSPPLVGMEVGAIKAGRCSMGA